jgi:preprotein translocase subunit SecF
MTYGEAANLAVNQTLVRSINTSVVALLPVAGLLFIGAGVLGTGTLKDLALALFVGIAAGTYSSIFIATPLVAQLKEREPQMQALAKRVAARQAAPRPVKAPPVAVSSGAAGPTRSATARQGPVPSEPAGGTGAEPEPEDVPADSVRRKVPAGQGPRQQPRKSTSRSKRRPSGKKRR